MAAEAPSAAALQLLTRRHVERVPYETLWIHAGETWTIDPHEAAARIAPPFRLQLEQLDDGSTRHLTHDANGGPPA